MLCTISGEAPEVPVASIKSGRVFEKRLIEAHIAEHGTDPISNEVLSLEDLVELQSSRIVHPRPPTLTSIPSLLSTFQNEWDALMLETFTIKKELAQARQELGTALYQNDAAVRVIARLTKERDEARDALSRLSIDGASARTGDAMQVDNQWLSQDSLEKVEATHSKLSSTRRKRTVPEDWATSDSIEALRPHKIAGARPGLRSIAISQDGQSLLVGGEGSSAHVISPDGATVQTFDIQSGSFTAGAWANDIALAGSSSGQVLVFKNGNESGSWRHNGRVNALAVHPCGQIVASVGADKRFVLYDLSSSLVAAQATTNSILSVVAFHPDGHLLAVGGEDGQIKLYDIKTGDQATTFDVGQPVQALKFSENGTWLAAAGLSTGVQVWDLRKLAQIKVLDVDGTVGSLDWDYTGQFLAIAGSKGVTVQKYTKASKEWTECLQSSPEALAAYWGPKAHSLFALSSDGSIMELR